MTNRDKFIHEAAPLILAALVLGDKICEAHRGAPTDELYRQMAQDAALLTRMLADEIAE